MFIRCTNFAWNFLGYWNVVIWRTKKFYSLDDLCFIFKNRKAYKMISNTPNPSLQNYFNIYAMFCLFNVEPIVNWSVMFLKTINNKTVEPTFCKQGYCYSLTLHSQRFTSTISITSMRSRYRKIQQFKGGPYRIPCCMGQKEVNRKTNKEKLCSYICSFFISNINMHIS